MNLLFANDRRGSYPPSWYAASAPDLPPFAPLTGEVKADVAIVGGGYTGLSAALHLARAGRKVALVEAHRVGFGASGRNGGQVGSGQRLDTGTLEALVGPEDTHAMWDLAEDAKALVSSLAPPEAHLTRGLAHACYAKADLAHEQEEAERLSARYGYDRIRMLDRAGIAALTGSEAFAGGSVDAGAGHLHPLAFARALARDADASGARIHEGTLATGLDPAGVTTEAGRITARDVILACNGYLGDLAPDVASRVMPINNFILATEPLDRFPEILPGNEAVADSKFVVSYWRKSHDNRLLFGGGESYGYRFPQDIAAKPRPPMEAIYPQLKGIPVSHAWGGTLAITMKRMPCFARPRPGLWSVSGYSGHGVAMAVMAGKILSEAVAGETGRFDLMARLPSPAFPGGHALRNPLLALAMTWYGLRDRLGL